MQVEAIPDCPLCQDNVKVRKFQGKWHCDICHGHPIEMLPPGHLYHALNNLLTHLGLEGSIDADHGFVWDTMTALKRIDGGAYLDNLAVPTEPDAHRDDMLAAVRMLEDGEWAEHFAKTPIGKRLEDAVTKLHGEASASDWHAGRGKTLDLIEAQMAFFQANGAKAHSAGDKHTAAVAHHKAEALKEVLRKIEGLTP